MIIDGYEAKVVEDTEFILANGKDEKAVLVTKDGHLRGVYLGTTQNNIILRQLIDAIRNADDERS